jgi:hypothetical protein
MNSRGRKNQREMQPIAIMAVVTSARRPEPWVSFNEAVNIIASHRRLEFQAALGALRAACLRDKVGWRYTPPLLDETGRPLLSTTRRPDMASLWSEIRSRELHPIERDIEIRESDLAHWPALPSRGPEPGKVTRFGHTDRALFGEIERIMKIESKSVTEAARDLDAKGKISGRGTSESRIRRLSRFYRNERLRLGKTRSH